MVLVCVISKAASARLIPYNCQIVLQSDGSSSVLLHIFLLIFFAILKTVVAEVEITATVGQIVKKDCEIAAGKPAGDPCVANENSCHGWILCYVSIFCLIF